MKGEYITRNERHDKLPGNVEMGGLIPPTKSVLHSLPLPFNSFFNDRKRFVRSPIRIFKEEIEKRLNNGIGEAAKISKKKK